MYGTINTLNAKKSNASEDDITKMLNSMWNGTKFLNTRSKVGQKPRFLIRVVYKDSYMIGLLDELVKIDNQNSNIIRKFDECELNFDALKEALLYMKEKIEKVVIYYDMSTKNQLKQFDELGLEIEKIEA
jgi:CRISPR-associated protein Csh2